MLQNEAGNLLVYILSYFKFKVTGVGLGRDPSGDAMRARDGRDRRAWKGRYFLRDLAGFAAIERLLAAAIVGERHYPDVIDPDPPPDVIAPAKGEGE